MFGNSSLDRVRQLFADQFEAEGDGYLYRKSSKGVPIHVTSAERDSFVAAFNRAVRWHYWVLLGAMLVMVVALAGWDLTTGQDHIEVQLYVGLGVVFAVYMLAWYRAWNAPARSLAGRRAAGPARSKAEAQRLALRRIGWSQMGLAALACLLMLWNLSTRENLLVGWSRLWLVGGALMIVALAYRAFQKWRLERSERLD